jgi:gliding motility-associated-like protein
MMRRSVNQVYVYRVTAFPVSRTDQFHFKYSYGDQGTQSLSSFMFTPNSDGLNDIFKVFGQFTAEVEFKIFNRWGELLFITNDLDKGWDGTYKSNLQPEGTYVFRATLIDQAGRTSDRSGTILLLRKRP